jgi:hypothetical protein
MRKVGRLGAAAAALVLGAASTAAADVAVYGDAPYGTSPTDTAQFAATPAFIDSINADPDGCRTARSS